MWLRLEMTPGSLLPCLQGAESLRTGSDWYLFPHWLRCNHLQLRKTTSNCNWWLYRFFCCCCMDLHVAVPGRVSILTNTARCRAVGSELIVMQASTVSPSSITSDLTLRDTSTVSIKVKWWVHSGVGRWGGQRTEHNDHVSMSLFTGG